MGKLPNFTADRVACLRCAPGKRQTIHWDGKTPGLGLRVTAGGSRSYIFESRLHGRTLRTTIGDVKTWTIKQAQVEATRLKRLTDKGVDPRQLQREEAAKTDAMRAKAEVEARRGSVLMKDAWDSYLAARSRSTGSTKWGPRHLLNHKNLAKAGGKKITRGRRKGAPETTQPGALYPLLAQPLCELDNDAVMTWLKQAAERGPTQAAQAYRALRAFLSWCARQEEYRNLVVTGACNRETTKDILPKPRAKVDCLQREQLAAWFAQVRALRNPVISAYLQTLLLTGPRREELAALAWQDVDFQWRSMTIRDKVDGVRVIPLTPYVAHLLGQLPRRNAWVFSSPTAKGGKVAEPRIAHRKALQAAGLPHVSLHGLRRSFGTLSEWVEVPVGIVAQIMGHKPSALAEKHYRVRAIDLLRLWHDKIEAWVLREADVPFTQDTTAQGLRVVSAA